MNIVNKLSGTKFGINLKDYDGITKIKSHGVMKYHINKPILKEYLIKNVLLILMNLNVIQPDL